MDFAVTTVDSTRDDSVFLLLVADGCVGSTTSRAVGSADATSVVRLTAIDRSAVISKWTTRDGKSGPVEIDGQKFDLAKGGVFLVSMKEPPTKVQQLSVDLSTLKGVQDAKSLKSLGETEPRIGAFLKSARGEK